jgi:hypothetical protein
MSGFGTTVSQSSFLLQSDGFVAGTLYGKYPDRYAIEGGVVGSAVTTPLYGGLPVTMTVVAPNSSSGGSSGIGQPLVAATALANIDGWTVFDQASASPISATSNVPLYYANASINFVRAGSGVYLVLPVNPSAVNTIAGGATNQTIYWNFTNNYVDVTGTGALGLQIIALNSNSKTVTYVAGPPITANWAAGGSTIVVRV